MIKLITTANELMNDYQFKVLEKNIIHYLCNDQRTVIVLFDDCLWSVFLRKYGYVV